MEPGQRSDRGALLRPLFFLTLTCLVLGLAFPTTTSLPCSCTNFADVGCGLGGCPGELMYQTRSCTPGGCDSEGFCAPLHACSPGHVCPAGNWYCSYTGNCIPLASSCNPANGMVGGSFDVHLCNPSTGQTWCEAKQKCLREWEEPCVASTSTTAPTTTTCPAGKWLCQYTGSCILYNQSCSNGLPGGDSDYYGCKQSAGYAWCEAKQKCLREWEEPCKASCVCTEFANVGCAKGNCPQGYMYQTRTCSPRSCHSESTCVSSPSCAPAASSTTVVPAPSSSPTTVPPQNAVGSQSVGAVQIVSVDPAFPVPLYSRIQIYNATWQSNFSDTSEGFAYFGNLAAGKYYATVASPGYLRGREEFILLAGETLKKIELTQAPLNVSSEEINFCASDSDCGCGRSGSQCMVGNVNYIQPYCHWPDFCTGIAGDLRPVCRKGRCELARSSLPSSTTTTSANVSQIPGGGNSAPTSTTMSTVTATPRATVTSAPPSQTGSTTGPLPGNLPGNEETATGESANQSERAANYSIPLLTPPNNLVTAGAIAVLSATLIIFVGSFLLKLG